MNSFDIIDEMNRMCITSKESAISFLTTLKETIEGMLKDERLLNEFEEDFNEWFSFN